MKLFLQEHRLSYLKWIVIGLLLRLIFISITLHGDLLHMNWTAHFLTYQGYLIPGEMRHPPLLYYTMSFFQLLFKPVMPLYADGLSPAISWTQGPHLFWYLFLLKSYYLIFDLGVAFLLLRLIKDGKKRLLAFRLWMLNPVVIFTSYFQGQFDVVPTFFVVLSLYYIVKNKLASSFFWLGIGAALKNFPFFFLIPAIILLGKTKVKKLTFLLLGTVPYLVLMYPYLGALGFKDNVMTTKYNQTFLNFRFSLGAFDTVYVFVVGYTLILIFTYFYSQTKESEDSFRRLWQTTLVICLWLYATSLFHPQWFVWVMPLLILLVVESKALRFFYWVLVICFFVYTFNWRKSLSWDLFSPLNLSFFNNLPSPYDIISHYYPAGTLVGISRSIFSGVSFFLIYWVLKQFFFKQKYRQR